MIGKRVAFCAAKIRQTVGQTKEKAHGNVGKGGVEGPILGTGPSIGGFEFSIGGFEISIGGFGFPVGGFGAPLRGNAQKNCRSGWKSPLRQLCLAGFRIPRRRGGCPLRSAVSVRPRARGAARSPACRSPLGLCLKRCRGRPKGVLRRWHWACPAWPPPRG